MIPDILLILIVSSLYWLVMTGEWPWEGWPFKSDPKYPSKEL